MSKYNTFHRAFIDYRKNTLNTNELKNERKSIKKSNIEEDVLNGTKYLCHINSDWIVAIEEGLPFIEKAIQEERQFIRSDGEIIPIEKVKKVSRESVEHLAKHSDMITHINEENEDDLIPDKLMMVEKYSDFAIYENRFLYMLLYQLDVFIHFRLSKIEELRSTYEGKMSFNKSFTSKTREFNVSLTLNEKMSNCPYPLKDEETDSLIQRIKDIQQIVNALLNRPLIIEVSKAPMIKPPIVKTNVLKMNNNFKKSLALYEFISTYKGDGYSYEIINNDLTPLKDDIADEISELVSLSLFLSFKYNNNLQEILDVDYKEEERINSINEQKELEAKIERLRKRVREEGKSLEEYMILLEQNNNMLLKDREELYTVKEQINSLNKEIEQLNLEKKDLKLNIDQLKEEIISQLHEINNLNTKYIEEINNLVNKNEQQIIDIKNENNLLINDMREDFKQSLTIKEEAVSLRIEQLNNEYDEKINKVNEEYNEKFNKVNEEYNEKIKEFSNEKEITLNSYKEKLEELNVTILNKENEKNSLISDYDSKLTKLDKETKEMINKVNEENIKMKKEYEDMKSKLTALQIKNNIINVGEEYTTEYKFEELQKEYELFSEFCKNQWNITKKAIRKELLGKKTKK